MYKLTQQQVLAMTKKERLEAFDYWTNLMLDTDYITNEIEYSFYAYNVNLLESKIEFNEY
jgi:hypothetical protein